MADHRLAEFTAPAKGRPPVLDRLERAVIVLLFAGMTVLGGVQVINRFLFRLPVWNLEQLLPHFLIAMTFLGLGATFRHRGHIAVMIVPEAMPSWIRRPYELVLWVMVMLFFVGLAIASAQVMAFQIEIGALTSMRYPAAILTGTIVVGCALSILRVIQHEIAPRLGGPR